MQATPNPLTQIGSRTPADALAVYYYRTLLKVRRRISSPLRRGAYLPLRDSSNARVTRDARD